MSPIKSLSGGERNRLMLARLFARPANVLVMDEPTNDLDIETLELLEELVADFPGTVLLVSHDRAFLDNIVTSTLAFEGNGRVVEYVGGWGDYLRQSEQGARSRDTAQRLRPERGAKSPRESERGWAASAEHAIEACEGEAASRADGRRQEPQMVALRSASSPSRNSASSSRCRRESKPSKKNSAG